MSEETTARGKVIIEFFEDRFPQAKMFGDIKPNDVGHSVMTMRKAYSDYINEVGKANKKRVAEKKAAEEAKTKEEE